ncbi:Caspase-9-like protein, partial [Leptotrombidium deliense]
HKQLVNKSVNDYLKNNFVVKCDQLVYLDLSSTHIIEKLESIDKNDEFKKYTKFKFIFVTHGGKCASTGKNVIFGSDSVPILLQDIVDIFKDSTSTHLKAKKKQFEFYTCDCVYPWTDVKNEVSGIIESKSEYSKETNNDMIVMWSTVDGFVSYRNTLNGSRFVNSINSCFRQYGETKEITEILRIVQTEVDNYEDKDGNIQVTEMHLIGFDKNFYFSTEFIENKPELKWNTYESTAASIGVCLIINMRDFKLPALKTRKGSEKDVENLETLFKHLKYDVYTHNNLKRDEIVEVIKECLRNKTKNIDSFVMFVMSHGHKSTDSSNYVYGSDGHMVNAEWLINFFNENECPNLRNKPKFLFFNCCRGAYKAVIDDENMKSKSGNEEMEISFFDEDEEEEDNVKYKNFQYPIRDMQLSWSYTHKATMREMVAGTRLAEHFLNNISEIQSRVLDVEIMQFTRLLGIICKEIGIRYAMTDISAIGLRKFFYLVKSNPNEENPLAYSMNSSPRGFAVIISNDNRNTTINAYHLSIIYSYLQFQVILLDDLTAIEIRDFIKKITKDERLRNHDALILHITTKLKRNELIFGVDNHQFIKTKNLVSYFNDYNCPLLKGKPKIISLKDREEWGVYETRTGQQISLCEQIREIFDVSLDLKNHRSGGTVLRFHTPFADFETKNEYEKQAHYVSTTSWKLYGKLKDAMEAITSEQTEETMGNIDMNAVLGKALNSIVPEIKPDMKIKLSEKNYEISDDQEEDEVYYHDFQEAIFKYSPFVHRSRHSKPRLTSAVPCFCQWAEYEEDPLD